MFALFLVGRSPRSVVKFKKRSLKIITKENILGELKTKKMMAAKSGSKILRLGQQETSSPYS